MDKNITTTPLNGISQKIGNTSIKEVLFPKNINVEKIKKGSIIGPFARIRGGTIIGENSKIGNFVETKKTKIGKSSKANHFAYLGDAEIGDESNIGAGTITCNYDGKNKHKTKIGSKSFVGTNSSLVAPVTIGSNAYVAAGLYIIDHMFFALAIAINTYFQKIADPKDIASTAGVSFTINHIAAVFIPVILGFVWINSHSIVFLIGSLFALLSLIASFFLPNNLSKIILDESNLNKVRV